MPSSYDKPQPEQKTLTAQMQEAKAKDLQEKVPEGNSKPFDRQSTITRLAVLNTATKILRTQDKPVSFDDVVALASRLEAWALGN